MNLHSLGWSDHWSQFDQNKAARIIAVHRGLCRAISPIGEMNCYLSGKFHYGAVSEDEYPAVGDWVSISPVFIDENGAPAALIESVLPRRSKISRASASSEQVIAANVDQAFIVTSANADLNVRRLQRSLVLAQEGGVRPVIVISKVDLKDCTESIKSLKQEFHGVEFLATSSESGEGLKDLRFFLKPGMTSVFVGSSGVGKSTLVNALLGEDIQATKAIREDDEKGRHTTTSRELFFTPEGGTIIDTPGLREVQVFGSSESVGSVFKSVEGLIKECKFSDCGHSSEPGCAVQRALAEGELSENELHDFQKLLREAEHSKRKMDKQLAANTKKKWKEIHVNMRKRRKFEGR